MDKEQIVAILDEADDKYGLPKGTLKAVAHQESGLNPKAYNKSSKASGLMQFVPGTAKDLGIDPFNINEAIEGAGRYLSAFYKKYKGDLDKTLAAYNWGPGNVDRHGLHNAPKETRNYISSIKTNISITKDSSIDNIAKELGYSTEGAPSSSIDDIAKELGYEVKTKSRIPSVLQSFISDKKDKTPKEQVDEIYEGVKDVGKSALKIGGQMALTPIAGITGLAKLATGSTPEEATQSIQNVQTLGGHLNPSNERQQVSSNVLNYIPSLIAKTGEKAGDITRDVTGSPTAATAVSTGVQMLPALAGKGIRDVPEKLTTQELVDMKAKEARVEPNSRLFTLAERNPDKFSKMPQQVVYNASLHNELPIKSTPLTPGQVFQDPKILSKEKLIESRSGSNNQLVQLKDQQHRAFLNNVGYMIDKISQENSPTKTFFMESLIDGAKAETGSLDALKVWDNFYSREKEYLKVLGRKDFNTLEDIINYGRLSSDINVKPSVSIMPTATKLGSYALGAKVGGPVGLIGAHLLQPQVEKRIAARNTAQGASMAVSPLLPNQSASLNALKQVVAPESTNALLNFVNRNKVPLATQTATQQSQE